MTDIEYFYAAHSAYAYLGSARLMAIAAAAGRRIMHRPFDLRRVATAPFGGRSAAHRDYFFRREILRWAEERGAPVLGHTPSHHARDIALPNSVLIAAQRAGRNVDRLAHAMLEAHWRDDADLADAATLAALARALGLDADELLAAAVSPAVAAEYAANTEEALRRSVFGSPTYFVDGDMFYGQDRLEMVERALRRPYRGTRWLEDRVSGAT